MSSNHQLGDTLVLCTIVYWCIQYMEAYCTHFDMNQSRLILKRHPKDQQNMVADIYVMLYSLKC